MNINEITTGLINILKNELQLPVPEDADGQTWLVDIGVDSMAMMSLWVYAEEKFFYETDEDALVGDQFKSIGDIAEYILKKLR